MTLEAPLHLQSRRLISNGHLIDATMTSRAADAFIYMNAVIEIGIVRKIVNPDPFHWFAVAKAGSHRLKVRTVGPDLFVTAHADFR